MPGLKMNTMLFPGGKRKALTLSYDDGVVQDRRLVKLMRQYGVKGTFNLNSGLLGRAGEMEVHGKMTDVSTVEPSEISSLYESFEVATHGVNHTALTGMGAAAMGEILEDRKALEELVPYLVRGHAYPFGLYDETVLTILNAADIQYARTVDSTGTFELPENFLKWNPTCRHSDPSLMELAHDFCQRDARFGQPQLFYLWGHTYEFDADENWNVIEEFLQYMSKHSEKIWMAANLEIAEYVKAYRRLVFSADGKKVWNPSLSTIWLEHGGKVHKIPSGELVEIGSF